MNFMRDGIANRNIREGDKCVIYISDHKKHLIKIEPGNELNTKFGILKAMELIDKPYGVKHQLEKGWILPLRLTPELWTELLPHRTQILYQADISMILLNLDIKPNSIVIESGTGSGSLSHCILRACLPNGFLHTFDINQDRVNQARQEFEEHGFGKNVKVTQRDICELGFGEELEGKADACILDLPTTWKAIEHAYKTLKNDGSHLCTFSPCIEQVQQNVAKMHELNLKEIRTVECLANPLELRTHQLRMWNRDVLEALAKIERVRMENLRKTLDPTKRAKIDQDSENRVEGHNPDDDEVEEEEFRMTETCLESEEAAFLEIALRDPKAPFSPNMLTKTTYMTARQPAESVGHSGFLTFACKR